MTRYLISYAVEGIPGDGWEVVDRDTPMSRANAEEVARHIEDRIGLPGVTVLGWQRYKDPAEQTGGRS